MTSTRLAEVVRSASVECVKCTFLNPTKLINLEMIQFSGRPGIELDIHQGPRNDIFVFVLHMPSFVIVGT